MGGGGTPSPLPEMLLEWAALATRATVVVLHPEDRPWPRQALVFALALLALPWTVSPPRTLASLLALIVPAVALLTAALASPRRAVANTLWSR